MSTPKHTHTPWQQGRSFDGHGDGRLMNADGHRIGLMDHEDDAARIVACVNACEGIADPSAVKDLLAACEALADLCGTAPGVSPAVDRARAAIAKARGGR